jgi:hypothetical protein
MPVGNGTAWAGVGDKTPDSQTLTIPNPKAGVWELDAYASHGAMNYGVAENKYVMDVAAKGVYAMPAQVSLAPFFGMEQSRKLSFANYYGDIQAVVGGVGFAQPKTERLEVEQNGAVDKFFDVAEGTAILRAGYSGLEDLRSDLDISLYYNDPKAGGWTQVGSTTGSALNGRTVELLNPAAGQYAVEIGGKQVPAGKTGFQFNLTQVQGGTGVKTPAGVNARGFGEQWSQDVTFALPSQPGGYLGAVTLTDKNTGKVLTVVPVEMK